MKTTTQWIGLATVVVLALSAIPAFADPVLIFNSAAGGSGLNQN